MNLPLLLGSGVLGLLVSFVSALLGGVSFGEALLRALVAGMLFGGVIQGLYILLKNFLPELMESSAKNASPAQEDPEENSVNIVLPDEAPDFSAMGREDSDEEVDYRRESAQDAVLESVDAHDNRILEDDSSEVDDIEEGLPELSAFEQAFSGDGANAGNRSSLEEGSRSSRSSVLLEGQEQDPAILAKAVSTVLKGKKEG